VVWLAQARSQLDVFGRAKARTIVAATGIMLWSGGQHDPDLLRDLSGMLGDIEERADTRSSSYAGVSYGEHIQQRPITDPAAIFALPAHEALIPNLQ
jgi:type IV secretory pathway TraG/TraD family ATPase VirD4